MHRFDLRLPPARHEVVTVHDLPPLRFSDEGHIPGWSIETARTARMVICPSEFAANEVRDLLRVERVAVVANGVGAPFVGAERLTFEERRNWGVEGPYVLHVGGSTQRKNLTGLAKAWRDLDREFPDLHLVTLGPDTPARRAPFEGLPRVVFPGYRDHHWVARLMASAEVVVVPSTYEGFGLPCIEAMAVGTPVVAAIAGALPEVCGDAALLVGSSGDALGEGLRQVLRDRRLVTRLVAAGHERARNFSWEASAAGHLAVYAEAFQ